METPPAGGGAAATSGGASAAAEGASWHARNGRQPEKIIEIAETVANSRRLVFFRVATLVG